MGFLDSRTVVAAFHWWFVLDASNFISYGARTGTVSVHCMHVASAGPRSRQGQSSPLWLQETPRPAKGSRPLEKNMRSITNQLNGKIRGFYPTTGHGILPDCDTKVSRGLPAAGKRRLIVASFLSPCLPWCAGSCPAPGSPRPCPPACCSRPASCRARTSCTQTTGSRGL